MISMAQFVPKPGGAATALPSVPMPVRQPSPSGTASAVAPVAVPAAPVTAVRHPTPPGNA